MQLSGFLYVFGVCGQLRWTVSLCPRKQLPSPASIHPPQAMFLPRLQWDPRPASHHVQEALLPLDLWVYLQWKCVCWQLQYYMYIFYYNSSLLPTLWYKLLTCPLLLLCFHAVSLCFTQNIMRTKHQRRSVRPDWPVSLYDTASLICFLFSCAFLCIDWNIVC